MAAALVRAVPDAAVVIVDVDERIAWAGGAPLERVSWRREEIVGRRLEEVLPEAAYAQVAGCCERALAGDRSEVMVTGPRSGRRHSLVVEPLLDEDRRPVAALAVLRDPRDADGPSQVADARFDSLFDAAPIGMALLSGTGRCVRANAALCELLGYSELELLNLSVDDVMHPDEAPESHRCMGRLMAGALVESGGERRLRHADGGLVHAALHTTAVRSGAEPPRHLVVQVKDGSERRQFEFRLQELAERDALTGLANRSQFERELRLGVAAWKAGGAPGALLLLDLDHFKYVNDAHGHGAGDELLLAVAGRVRAELPAGALVARIGGDELAALVPAAGAPCPHAAAQDLVAAVRAQRFAVGGEALGTTASVGVVQMAEGIADPESLLVAADLAMYRAKASGGDRAVLHDPAHRGREQVSADLRWSQRIRGALAEQRLELHAQPIADAATGRADEYELLVRMRDDHGALVGPTDFLPHAERFGLVGEIDRWVVGQAVALASRLDVTLAVNLSGRSVGDPELLAFLEDAIAGAGLDPRRLIFEVTETAAIASMGDAQRLAAGLRRLGCGFALDDFGAGFASFTYVKQLPFDYLKIDGSFVRDLPTNASDRLVVSALVEVARGLGKRTVAEYVCSAEVLAEVRACGVDLVQGNHVGAPAPLDAWLAARPPRAA